MSGLLPCLLSLAQGLSCDSDPVALQLGSGTLGSAGTPELILGGAPAILYPLTLRVSGLSAGAAGSLAISSGADEMPLPFFGATVFPAQPVALLPFTADDEGASPILLTSDGFQPSACGAQLVCQALALDAAATGGASFTPAARLTIGAPAYQAPFDGYAASIGVVPEETLVLDVNADGNVDLVTVESLFTTLTVSLGGPDGVFRAGESVDLDVSSTALAAGFLDGDPFADLALTDRIADTFLVLFGDANADFTVAQTVDTVEDPESIAFGEFNGDGRTDIAVCSDGDGLVVHFGQPGGSFGPLQVLDVDGRFTDLAVGDFDLDGVGDIATVNILNGEVEVWLGTRSGLPVPSPPVPTTSCANRLVSADVEGDGILDLGVVSCSSTQRGVFLLRGVGDGSFQPAWPMVYEGLAVQEIAFGDLDLDGNLDLVAADLATTLADTSRARTARGLGEGNFAEVDAVTVGSFPIRVSIVAADADGVPDVIVASSGPRTASVLYGEGGGMLSAPRTFESISFPRSLAVGDLDGDGRSDLVVGGSGEVGIQLAEGDGFGSPDPIDLLGTIDGVRIERVDADPFPDVVTFEDSFDQVQVLPGLGDGTFGAPVLVPSGDGPRDVAFGDFNSDGLKDIAVACDESGDVTIALADGMGGFVAGVSLDSELSPRGIDVGDLDDDGIPDIAIAMISTFRDIRVYRGLGGGGFSLLADLPMPEAASDVAIADFNEDGIPDLVAPSSAGPDDTVSLFLGTGGGAFATSVEFPAGIDPSFVQVADLNGDLHLDLALFSAVGLQEGITMLRGTGDGGFLPPIVFHAGDDPTDYAIGRFGDDLVPSLFVSRDLGPIYLLESNLLE